jgi:hypothetical protein
VDVSRPATTIAMGRPRINFHLKGRDVALADVSFEAHYGSNSDIPPCPKSARSGSHSPSFDDLVNPSQDAVRKG